MFLVADVGRTYKALGKKVFSPEHCNIYPLIYLDLCQYVSFQLPGLQLFNLSEVLLLLQESRNWCSTELASWENEVTHVYNMHSV